MNLEKFRLFQIKYKLLWRCDMLSKTTQKLKAGPDDGLSRLEREQSAHLAPVLAAFLAHFCMRVRACARVRWLTCVRVSMAAEATCNRGQSLLTPRSGMQFLDPDGTVALQIVVKAHLSADSATVACISSHVRPALLHELHACDKLVRKCLSVRNSASSF